MPLKLGERFLDNTTVIKICDNQYHDEFTVEIYCVGIPYIRDSFINIDTGIIIKIKGKEIYRNYKTDTIVNIVHDLQKDLLNETLGIR